MSYCRVLKLENSRGNGGGTMSMRTQGVADDWSRFPTQHGCLFAEGAALPCVLLVQVAMRPMSRYLLGVQLALHAQRGRARASVKRTATAGDQGARREIEIVMRVLS